MNHLKNQLKKFTASCHWYATKNKKVVYTDGIKYLVDNQHADWLIDIVSTYQKKSEILSQPFQKWHLETDNNTHDGILIMNGGKHMIEHVRHQLKNIDFSLTTFEFYVISDYAMKGYLQKIMMLKNRILKKEKSTQSLTRPYGVKTEKLTPIRFFD
jgi:bifunctional ADP-heptose synthase (sugar kinase/adenylyltransferase)